jgi:UTP--glucose-1-phosphate uridylyltransferase
MSGRVYKVHKLFENPNSNMTQSNLANNILETLETGRGGEIKLTDAISKINQPIIDYT